MSIAWAVTQQAWSPLSLAAPRGWSGIGMRPRLLVWAQAVDWFAVLALARSQRRLAWFQ